MHLEILKLAKELGVEFAFPSSTLMIEQFPDKKGISVPYNTDSERLKNIIDKIK